ncbi:MAG: hypothetical protein L6Q71_04170 [Planctomycetes bacterium]|nr:hypothetical protein [Planctomycetota bacterium]
MPSAIAKSWMPTFVGMTLILLLSSCASVDPRACAVPPEQLPVYRIVVENVETPEVSADGYKLLLRFKLHSRGLFPYPHLIQEITQTATYYTNGRRSSHAISLVECFRLNSEPQYRDGEWIYGLEPLQRDKHFESGFAATPRGIERIVVTRAIKLYPGVVENADFTLLGFAHLPSNRSGSVRTNIPANFNRGYQDDHQLRGTVLIDDGERNWREYELAYDWRRTGEGAMNATLTFDPLTGIEADRVTVSSPAAVPSSGAGGDR